jgi:hypothetical protein
MENPEGFLLPNALPAMEFGTPVRGDLFGGLVSRSNMESELLWIGVCGDGAKGMSSGNRNTSH